MSGAQELFGGLDEQQLGRLAEYLTVDDVPSGRSLGRQGQPATEFVTVLEGRVGVTIDGVPHAVLDDGSHFGALALLDNPADPVHRASFSVMVPSLIAAATPQDFRKILDEFPSVAQRIRAMADVRRAYLAGLEHGNHDDRTTMMEIEVLTYPVHINF